MRLRALATLSISLAALTACGGGEETPEIASAEAPGGSPLPAVEVTDLHTGGAVDLAAQLPAEQPLLVWFWAPH